MRNTWTCGTVKGVERFLRAALSAERGCGCGAVVRAIFAHVRERDPERAAVRGALRELELPRVRERGAPLLRPLHRHRERPVRHPYRPRERRERRRRRLLCRRRLAPLLEPHAHHCRAVDSGDGRDANDDAEQEEHDGEDVDADGGVAARARGGGGAAALERGAHARDAPRRRCARVGVTKHNHRSRNALVTALNPKPARARIETKCAKRLSRLRRNAPLRPVR
mmetsp:Transcript_22965/g.74822  ORF Transcript_22965/g.74822 Transcript_22965/m.74822 type:complete len:224 (-) Transcript_22965:505-1176(-)